KVDPGWTLVGYGSFDVAGGVLRTAPDEKGLGLLLYTKEKFGDCQIRVVFRAEDAKSNAGVFVRIDDGILQQVGKNHAPAKRDERGKLTTESLQIFKDASERGIGAWYAVHHGYEVQICDHSDPLHRTGAIYSLAQSAEAPQHEPDAWRTMVITLKGNQVLVELDGKPVTAFDPADPSIPPQKEWYEPRREAKRPQSGYIGLQVHDPGDIVEFKSVSVRPLQKSPDFWHFRPELWRVRLRGRCDLQALDSHVYSIHNRYSIYSRYAAGIDSSVDAGNL
ncbi:MAG TPA: DUF1080 domain-containing protein, partial [Pirellulaceae bacterium]|nr:DUF1080 domain-containing protein [Pirellulaceae bacterium]